ncbi:MAG TPA: O-antigen ligase family protein [Blastocatellia bacterium]
MSANLEKAILVGLLIAIFFTALAHGAVEPWSVAAFELIVLALLILWITRAIIIKRFRVTIPAAAWPILALILYGFLQSLAFTDSAGRTLSLSMDVEATRKALTMLIFLFISFLIAVNFLTRYEWLRKLGNILVIYGLAMAVFGLLQHFSWNGGFYWFRQTERDLVFGPFVNHNHFAGYMEMLIQIPVALLITRGVRRELWALYAFAAVMMGIALVASLSRGGMISLAAGMLFVAFFGIRPAQKRRKRRAVPERSFSQSLELIKAGAAEPAPIKSRPARIGEDEVEGGPPVARLSLTRRVVAVAVIAAAIVAGILWVGPDPVADRIAEGSDSRQETFFSSRGWIWQDSIAMIGANPFTGVGMGAFETAYPRYSLQNGAVIVGEAHNDYLQVLADCGIAGALLALCFIVATMRAVGRAIRSRDPYLSGLALGSGAAIFSILVHSLFDFNLQLPSNALLFLFFSAIASNIATGMVESRSEKKSQRIIKPGASLAIGVRP